jgi:hypothetical protein
MKDLSKARQECKKFIALMENNRPNCDDAGVARRILEELDQYGDIKRQDTGSPLGAIQRVLPISVAFPSRRRLVVPSCRRVSSDAGEDRALACVRGRHIHASGWAKGQAQSSVRLSSQRMVNRRSEPLFYVPDKTRPEVGRF